MYSSFLRTILAFLIALALSLPGAKHHVSAQDATPLAEDDSIEMTVSWLLSQQAEDGGFAGFSPESDPGLTIDAVLALAAAEHAGIDTENSIADSIAYLETSPAAEEYAELGSGQAARLLLALQAAGSDVDTVGEVNLVGALTADGAVAGLSAVDQAYVLLALSTVGEEVPETAIVALTEMQAPNGGWGWDGAPEDATTDSNTTSLVIQALVASGLGQDDLVEAGLVYLETLIQGEDGVLYSTEEADAPDANSTALVTQAVIAAGEDPASQEWGDLPTALVAFQEESGGFVWQQADTEVNMYATVQAIPALTGQPLPITSGEAEAHDHAFLFAA